MAACVIVNNNALFSILDEEGVEAEGFQKTYKERGDPFSTMTEDDFIRNFRLSKSAAIEVCDNVAPELERQRQRTRWTLTVAQQVLITLRFLATGSFFGSIGSDINFRCSVSTVSRTVHVVTQAICRRMSHLIFFPQSAEERLKTKVDFHSLRGMPGCLGVMDGTVIAITSPSQSDPRFTEASYYCHKGYHAINALIICDSHKRITFIDATSPGCDHDAYIWGGSLVKQKACRGFFEDGEWLLGDSGYPLEPWLMTPVTNPQPGSKEANYNKAHGETRVIIEHCIGVLKSRFRCLQRYRTLHFNPQRCTNIIHACAILHNLCLNYNLALDEGLSAEGIINEDYNFGGADDHPVVGNTLRDQGMAIRQHLIANCF